jgi:hypothetical protein
MPKIKFLANRPWLNLGSKSRPIPVVKTIPEWFRKADRFAINPMTNEPWVSPQDGGKIPTWKACPAIFDIMSTGYVMVTPCDIEFYLDQNGKIAVKVADPMYQDFCTPRGPMHQFQHPEGYYLDHFAWWTDWGVKVPDGYSVLYTQPLNRYELPFLSTSGIIDNDKVNLSGTMPFFLVKGFTGVIPAGTPYVQLIPFKREDWVSDYEFDDPRSMYEKNMKNSEKYRIPNGGVYKNTVWSKRKYE